MFRFLHSRNGYTPSSMLSSSSFIRFFSSDYPQHSFTVSYLIHTCGLSPKSALSASKTLRFRSSEQPDSVLSCFHKFGFSKSNVSQMITKFPNMLCCNPQNTISPKLDFFRSIGVSPPEIVTIFTVNPWIVKSSLENRLVRTFNILIEMFQSEDKAIEVIKQNPYALQTPEAALNVNALRETGVPESNVVWLIQHHSICIGTNSVKFGEAVEKVKELGFDPMQLRFVLAIMVLTVSSKSKWDGRVAVYKRWGWSDKDVTTAFKKSPWCMTISEDKIMDVMDFFVNKLGVESSILVNCPLLLGYSLKKRLIPRGAVSQYLSSKGLLKLDSKISSIFLCSEKCFLEKYVNCHEDAPHLMKLYNDKLNEAISEGKRKS